MGTISIGHHSLITGGTFTQVNHSQNVQQSPLDRLQAAVAPAALYNSAERFDCGRCHPNTRVTVINELIDWVVQAGDFFDKRMLWLNGPAGAGKSAIAQTLAEICSMERCLLASFFFNRSDPSRNNPKRLVATLAYQIYRVIPSYHQDLLLDVIRQDPLIFDQAIAAQLQALIVAPLQSLFEINFFNGYHAPRFIVLDGLDECSTGAVQVNLLAALQAMLAQANIPFLVLVASRPEHDIQMYFRSPRMGTPIHELDLDESYLPDADITLFVREKLAELHKTHPFKDRIPPDWPSDEVIQVIVGKSSGQFIYASVVIKYVTSTRHFPPDRLDVVRHLRPAKRDMPFAELDALYSYIFSCVEDISLVLRILHAIMLFDAVEDDDVVLSALHVEALCGLQEGECFSALCDLQSLLRLPLDPKDDISFLHKSLPDYLQDPARSLDYHVDTSSQTAAPIISRCFQLILERQYNDVYGMFIYLSDQDDLLPNIQQLHGAIMSYSVEDQWKMKHDERAFRFAMFFLDTLHDSLYDTDYEYLYWHHLRQLQDFALKYPELFKNQGPLSDWTSAMVVLFIVSEKSITGVSPGVFAFLHAAGNPSFNADNKINDVLAADAAHRCINTLVHDSRAKFVSFALEWLHGTLWKSTPWSRTLYDACQPASMLSLSMQKAEHPSELASKVEKAMADYRHRYLEEEASLVTGRRCYCKVCWRFPHHMPPRYSG